MSDEAKKKAEEALKKAKEGKRLTALQEAEKNRKFRAQETNDRPVVKPKKEDNG